MRVFLFPTPFQNSTPKYSPYHCLKSHFLERATSKNYILPSQDKDLKLKHFFFFFKHIHWNTVHLDFFFKLRCHWQLKWHVSFRCATSQSHYCIYCKMPTLLKHFIYLNPRTWHCLDFPLTTPTQSVWQPSSSSFPAWSKGMKPLPLNL